jgi:hypothetical protein
MVDVGFGFRLCENSRTDETQRDMILPMRDFGRIHDVVGCLLSDAREQISGSAASSRVFTPSALEDRCIHCAGRRAGDTFDLQRGFLEQRSITLQVKAP